MKKPWLAAALQLVCVTGGLGYMYLGAWKEGALVLLALWLMHGANYVCAENEWKAISMVLGPSIWIVQVLTALDAWRQARAALSR